MKMATENLKLRLENVDMQFFEILTTGSETEMEGLIGWADDKVLTEQLGTIETIITTPNNNKLSVNLVHAVLNIFRGVNDTVKTNAIKKLKKALIDINNVHPAAIASLVRIGIPRILTTIMKRETENQAKWECKKYIPSVHLISAFFPAIELYSDIDDISDDIICTGPDEMSNHEMRVLLEATLPALFDICQRPNCPTAHHALLLKLIHWASEIKALANVVSVEKILKFVKVLMNPAIKANIVIGIAIAKTLCGGFLNYMINEKVFEWLKENMSDVLTWPKHEVSRTWVRRMYTNLVSFWLNADTKFQLDDGTLISKITDINSILDFIMPDITYKVSKECLNIRYRRLREFIKYILNLPDLSHHEGKLTVNSEGITKFNNLVTSTVNILDAIFVRSELLGQYSDLRDIDEYLHVPKTYKNIKLNLCKSASFDRVLGSSKSTEELRRNPMVRTLRLLSILYEVNENWGVLFCSLSKDILIDRSCFVSGVLKEVMNNVSLKSDTKNLTPNWIINFATNYPFLMLMKHRQTIVQIYFSPFKPFEMYQYFEVNRKSTLNFVSDNLDSMVKSADHMWMFRFIGETAQGNGPSQEFYSEFSRDCKRFDRALWSGDKGEIIHGVSYVNSQLGLFPKPSTNPKACLAAIGVIIAKSLVDNRRMDINFSNGVYKCLFKKDLNAQHLSLTDIKDVMPSIFNFVVSLVDILREKWFIANDDSLTEEEQNKAISNITCDGCSFEDLCVNFTLPGYPDIEMMEGGSETLLSIDNVKQYLKMLVWFLLYKNPQQSIKMVSSGFKKILNPDFMKYFYPHEYEEILSGVTEEQWTVDYLKKNCVLSTIQLTAEKPEVQYLFEVLSSLSASDQRNFLQFVTSSPRLPIGGLAALNPKLNISYSTAKGKLDKLPSASTCYCTLRITNYSSKEVLKEKLLLAIREGRGSFAFS